MHPVSTAEEITHSSKSNLALAFFSLPPDRRRDITVFYAFCRVVDDVADSPSLPLETRHMQLALWKESLSKPMVGEHPLAPELRDVIARYRIPINYFHDILAGVEMDLTPMNLKPVRFKNFAQLRVYCYRVASVVGLVSIEIFGYTNPLCKAYAESLGLALQLTNILRDVGEDYANGRRIYLPWEDMARFQYSEEDLGKRRYNSHWLALANFQANRAFSFYESARVPKEDRKRMIPAEIMRSIYLGILWKMKRDGFRVLHKRYRLNRMEKGLIIAKTLATTHLGI